MKINAPPQFFANLFIFCSRPWFARICWQRFFRAFPLFQIFQCSHSAVKCSHYRRVLEEWIDCQYLAGLRMHPIRQSSHNFQRFLNLHAKPPAAHPKSPVWIWTVTTEPITCSVRHPGLPEFSTSILQSSSVGIFFRASAATGRFWTNSSRRILPSRK